MNRDPQFSRDKQLLAIHRERRELWRRKPQYVELDPPIPRGWVRHWRLTARARNRHDAWVLQTILQVIDHPHYHWRRNFTHGRHRRRTRRMIENTQFPNSVREHRWKRLGWPEQWKIFFRQILVNEGRSDQTYSYKFRRLDLLELFVERYYTYYAELIDPAQKAREAEIETFLVHRGGDHRLTTLLDKGWRSGPDPRQKILARLANRRIRKALEGDWEAEVRRKASSSHLGSSFDQTTFSGAYPAMSTSFNGRRLRQRSSRLLTGIAGCMSLWTDHSFIRPLVKQHHVWPTPRNRGGRSFTGDHSSNVTIHHEHLRHARHSSQRHHRGRCRGHHGLHAGS